MANAFKFLASMRVMHIDLKAENILLQRVEPGVGCPHGYVAKVADFGLAQVGRRVGGGCGRFWPAMGGQAGREGGGEGYEAVAYLPPSRPHYSTTCEGCSIPSILKATFLNSLRWL